MTSFQASYDEQLEVQDQVQIDVITQKEQSYSFHSEKQVMKKIQPFIQAYKLNYRDFEIKNGRIYYKANKQDTTLNGSQTASKIHTFDPKKSKSHFQTEEKHYRIKQSTNSLRYFGMALQDDDQTIYESQNIQKQQSLQNKIKVIATTSKVKLSRPQSSKKEVKLNQPKVNNQLDQVTDLQLEIQQRRDILEYLKAEEIKEREKLQQIRNENQNDKFQEISKNLNKLKDEEEQLNLKIIFISSELEAKEKKVEQLHKLLQNYKQQMDTLEKQIEDKNEILEKLKISESELSKKVQLTTQHLYDMEQKIEQLQTFEQQSFIHEQKSVDQSQFSVEDQKDLIEKERTLQLLKEREEQENVRFQEILFLHQQKYEEEVKKIERLRIQEELEQQKRRAELQELEDKHYQKFVEIQQNLLESEKEYRKIQGQIQEALVEVNLLKSVISDKNPFSSPTNQDEILIRKIQSINFVDCVQSPTINFQKTESPKNLQNQIIAANKIKSYFNKEKVIKIIKLLTEQGMIIVTLLKKQNSYVLTCSNQNIQTDRIIFTGLNSKSRLWIRSHLYSISGCLIENSKVDQKEFDKLNLYLQTFQQ